MEHFHSTEVNCPYCLVKSGKEGKDHYYHQMLVAVLVHPDHQEVFPLACEAIILFEWANNLPLNHANADLRVNLVQYTQTNSQGKKTSFSWIVSWKLTRTKLIKTMRMGRARWKIENETFNTLKNQGYHFEHNFGHGSKHLATVLDTTMLLVFYIDQIQQHASRTFRLVWKGLKTRKKLWSAMRASFAMIKTQSMSQLWEQIAWEYEIEIDSSS